MYGFAAQENLKANYQLDFDYRLSGSIRENMEHVRYLRQ
jgi:hypothetical protein